MRVSVSEIARKAGVSPATVSRVLHGGKGVSPEKVDLVQRALDGSQSMPRMRGSSASLSKSKVALLLVEPDDLLPCSLEIYRILLNLEAVLREKQIELTVGIVRDQGNLPRSVMDGEVDGLLLAGASYPPRFKGVIERLPSVWLTSRHEEKADISLAGNEDIGRMAASHLLGRGHTSLAYFQIPEDHPVHTTRCEFFEFTAVRAGAKVQRFCDKAPAFDADEFTYWGRLYECVRRQVKQLIGSKSRPTGVFIPLGMLTGLVYRAFAEFGIVPGRDVEIVCCDQTMAMLMSLSPRPTSIHIDTSMIARRAVEELLVQLGGRGAAPAKSVRIFIEPHLYPGAFTSESFGAD